MLLNPSEDMAFISSYELVCSVVNKGPGFTFEKPFLKVLLVYSVLPGAEIVSPLLRLSLCLSFPTLPTLCNLSLL